MSTDGSDDGTPHGSTYVVYQEQTLDEDGAENPTEISAEQVEINVAPSQAGERSGKARSGPRKARGNSEGDVGKSFSIQGHGCEDGIQVYDVSGRTWLAGPGGMADIIWRLTLAHEAVLLRIALLLEDAEGREKRGDFSGACSLYLDAVQRCAFIDQSNPAALQPILRLAKFYESAAISDAAESWYVELVYSCMRCHGKSNERTLDALNRLGVFYDNQGMTEEASAIYSRSLVGRRKVLGPFHYDTLITTQELANTKSKLGFEDEALVLLKLAYDGFKTTAGVGDRMTLTTANNLANVYEDFGRVEEARSLLAAAILDAAAAHGPADMLTLALGANLILQSARSRETDHAATILAVVQVCDKEGLRRPLEILLERYEELGRADDALQVRSYISNGTSQSSKRTLPWRRTT
jgi:tetratricopeptide (TPR) repeat protein